MFNKNDADETEIYEPQHRLNFRIDLNTILNEIKSNIIRSYDIYNLSYQNPFFKNITSKEMLLLQCSKTFKELNNLFTISSTIDTHIFETEYMVKEKILELIEYLLFWKYEDYLDSIKFINKNKDG